jgi:probable F420-dependent oxidoreductase
MATTPAGLDLGVVLPPYATVAQLRAAAEIADNSGIHSLWVGDRTGTVTGIPWGDALTMLSALASMTERVRIGTSVLVLPRRNPVFLAHALATVEQLSGGRLIAGFGVGDPAITGPGELAIAGVEPSARGRTADEYLDLLRRLWNNDDVSHDSDNCRFESFGLGLRPSRPVPVWIGGHSAAARRRAARFGDGWLTVMSSPGRFSRGWAEVRDSARQYGRNGDDLVPAVQLFGAIDTAGTSSKQRLDTALRNLLGVPLAAVEDGCVWGTPRQWQDRIGAWHAAGVRHVNAMLFTADLPADIRLIAEQVVPDLLVQPVSAG